MSPSFNGPEPEDLLPEDVPGEEAPASTPEQYERDKWAEADHPAATLIAPDAFMARKEKDDHPEDGNYSSFPFIPGGLA